jgi:hypothetical protein
VSSAFLPPSNTPTTTPRHHDHHTSLSMADQPEPTPQDKPIQVKLVLLGRCSEAGVRCSLPRAWGCSASLSLGCSLRRLEMCRGSRCWQVINSHALRTFRTTAPARRISSRLCIRVYRSTMSSRQTRSPQSALLFSLKGAELTIVYCVMRSGIQQGRNASTRWLLCTTGTHKPLLLYMT